MAMLTRLSDPAIGFNAAYAAIQGSYGTPAITINWDASINASPRNFTFGDVPPDLLEQSSPFEYRCSPSMRFAARSADTVSASRTLSLMAW
jgi:hypothetical protein